MAMIPSLGQQLAADLATGDNMAATRDSMARQYPKNSVRRATSSFIGSRALRVMK